MSKSQSRAEFFANNPRATAWAALDDATNQQKRITPGAVRLRTDQLKGKRAIILGAGVAGLTTAYELLAQESGMEVKIFEALNRTGGRCLSLRTGDTLVEDEDHKLFDSKPRKPQMVRFKRPVGDSEPYLNAGPGRIPSSHKRLLSYLKRFGVDVEVYVMNSESNLVRLKGGPLGDEPHAYRRLDHNTRGWIAQMVYAKAEELLRTEGFEIGDEDFDERVEQLRELMISFGELIADGKHKGKYVPTSGRDGLEEGRSRAGFEVLPGVDAGVIAKAISLDKLLSSEFWSKTRFYQPVDFLWQPTLFQPVGGMDQVQHAFAQQVAALGGTVYLNSPVKRIDWDAETREFVVQVGRVGTGETEEHRAEYCFSNIAIPFLKRLVSEDLQNPKLKNGFNAGFKKGLQAVYDAQFGKDPDESGYASRFLANTTKVGWQADRDLWQGSTVKPRAHGAMDLETLRVPKSEVGVVPIFGGISWTEHEIVQIWYPSDAYHDQKGILTGAYNFGDVAFRWGTLPPEKRLEMAREGAAGFGDDFAAGLRDGVAIAWQNMPHIKGGWAQWHAVKHPERHFNQLIQGTGVDGDDAPVFFIIGDQVSSLPGWQEGAIASA
ncbi:MAG: FAD-dependent oxidoreductase, partial [Acidobacteriota bacterium]